MRVLHLIDTGGPGGAETVLALIVSRFHLPPYQSRVILPSNGWLAHRLRGMDADTIVLPNRSVSRLGYLLALRREIDRFRPDLIHAHLFGAAFYASLAARAWPFVQRPSPPVVCTFHGRPDVRTDDPLVAWKAGVISRHSNRLVYVSHDLRSHLEPLLGAPHLSRVIHNGVPAPRPSGSRTHREEGGAAPEELLIGAVGNIRVAKDYPNLLHAMQLVRAARRDVRLVVVGQGLSAQRKDLQDRAAMLGISGAVRFVGFQPDTASWIASYDLFVSSSSTEGLPLATIEAMALRKPIVATRCGGVPELITSGVHGLLVPPRDPRALADGILLALSDAHAAGDWARAAQFRARSEFGVQRMTDAYQALYHSVCDRSSGVAAVDMRRVRSIG